MSKLTIRKIVTAMFCAAMLLAVLVPASLAQSDTYAMPARPSAAAESDGSTHNEYTKAGRADLSASLIVPPSANDSDEEDDNSGVDFILPPSSGDDEEEDNDSGVDLILPPSSGDDEEEDDDSGVDLILPPSSDSDEEEEDDSPLVEFIKPSGSSYALGARQFSMTPIVNGRAISAKITGASNWEIEVLLLDQSGDEITSASRIGDGVVALGKHAPGNYIVLARYVTPTDDAQARSAVVTVSASSGSSSSSSSGSSSNNSAGSSSNNTLSYITNYPILQPGERNDPMIYSLQKRLKELGYYTIAVDGIFGSGTQRAVRNFQRMNGLRITGIADDKTQRALYASSAIPASSTSSSSGQNTGYRLLYWGCEGSAVIRLQNALIKAGYKPYVRIVDGVYGQWTYDAVCAYQRDHGLTVDGVAGRNTQNSLYGTNY